MINLDKAADGCIPNDSNINLGQKASATKVNLWSKFGKKLVKYAAISRGPQSDNQQMLKDRAVNLLLLWIGIYKYNVGKFPQSIIALDEFIKNSFPEWLPADFSIISPVYCSNFESVYQKKHTSCFPADRSTRDIISSEEDPLEVFFLSPGVDGCLNIDTRKKDLISLICEGRLTNPAGSSKEEGGNSASVNYDQSLLKAMRQALINLIKKNKFSSEASFYMFKALSEAQEADPEVLTAIIELIRSNKLKHKERFKVFDIYANSQIMDPVVEKALDNVMLDLFAENKVLEPKVTEKLRKRLAGGKIKAEEIDRSIVFYERLFVNNKRLLIIFISGQIEFFANKDGIDKVQNVIRHLQMSLRNESDFIRQLAVDLQTKLQLLGVYSLSIN